MRKVRITESRRKQNAVKEVELLEGTREVANAQTSTVQLSTVFTRSRVSQVVITLGRVARTRVEKVALQPASLKAQIPKGDKLKKNKKTNKHKKNRRDVNKQ